MASNTLQKGISGDRSAFVHKVARSITEIQANVNNVADVLVFLEVLGYSDRTAFENGYSDLRELARKVYDYVDFFENLPAGGEELKSPFLVPIASVKRRLLESLGFAFPGLATLGLLYTFGFSLWLTWILPLPVVTANAIGVFFGALITEGHTQTYSRTLMFAYNQGNTSESRRILKRSYYALGAILATCLVLLYGLSGVLGVPQQLFVIAALATAGMAVPRVCFMTLYTVRRIGPVVLCYSLGFASLLLVYFAAAPLIPDTTIRYLASLSVTSVLLAATGAHYSRRVLLQREAVAAGNIPHFFRSISVSRKTIRPRFAVQFWETLPYFLFGTFFFALLFGDRILSWAFNPLRGLDGVGLPLLFNTAYHIGADLAMFILFPVGLLQYVIITPIFEQLSNLSLELKVTEVHSVDRAMRKRYAVLQLASLGLAGAAALAIITLGPTLTPTLVGSEVSVGILRVAAISNVFLSLYLGNSLFIMVFNRPRWLAITAILGVSILGGSGLIFAQLGFEKIIYAYLVASVSVATLSFLAVGNFLKRPASLFFSRFV